MREEPQNGNRADAGAESLGPAQRICIRFIIKTINAQTDLRSKTKHGGKYYGSTTQLKSNEL